MLLDVVHQYQVVTGAWTPYIWAFRAWFTVRNPDLMIPEKLQSKMRGVAQHIDTDNRSEFLENALIALARLDSTQLTSRI